jgi:hypothetical protein
MEREHEERWYTTRDTGIYHVNVNDVDNDSVNEILTVGGFYMYPTYLIDAAQIRIWNWNGTILTLEHSEDFYDVSLYGIKPMQSYSTDVDQDGVDEIVVAGYIQQQQNPGWAKGKIWIWNWNGTHLIEEHTEEWGDFSSTEHAVASDVLAADFDNDGTIEIATSGRAHSYPVYGSIRIWTWNGSNFELHHIEEWNSTHGARIDDATTLNVNQDETIELVTTGYANNGTYWHGQLRVWQWTTTDGLNLLQNTEWGALGSTESYSVSAEDVDKDLVQEIITTGRVHDGIRYNGQLRIWYLPVLTIYPINWNEHSFNVTTLSNSTISNFAFNQSLKKLTFNVTVPSYMKGYCNITFPNALLGGPYSCQFDGLPSIPSETSNSTHTSLYFTYQHDGQIEILGTTVIPEFPNLLIPLLIVMLFVSMLFPHLHSSLKQQ